MKRKIRTYGGYFEAFMETLKEKEQEKIQYGLLLEKPRAFDPRGQATVTPRGKIRLTLCGKIKMTP